MRILQRDFDQRGFRVDPRQDGEADLGFDGVLEQKLHQLDARIAV